MATAPQGQLRQDPHRKSGNEAWKAKWDDHLAWSTSLAVIVHVAIFVFWPAWEREAVVDLDEEPLGASWISLFALPSNAAAVSSDTSTPPVAVIAEPDSLPEATFESGVVESELAFARVPGGTEGLRERLAGRDGPFPSIVEPEPADEPPITSDELVSLDEEEGAEEGTEEETEVKVTVIEDPMIVVQEIVPETSPLDLSRLAGIRPEIVLQGVSAWILIRNPSAVDRFLNKAYDPEVEGMVDVAVWIDKWGSVEWAEISTSSGVDEMDEIALALFNSIANFRPALDRGIPVSMSAIFSVPFPW